MICGLIACLSATAAEASVFLYVGDTGNSQADGFFIVDGILYVYDKTDEHVYAYNITAVDANSTGSSVRVNSLEFPCCSGARYPTVLTYHDGIFYLGSSGIAKVYTYYPNGTASKQHEFSLDTTRVVTGIEYYDGIFYIQDLYDTYV